MDMWNYLAGGAAVGLIASCWSKIKDFVWRFTSLLIQRIEIESEPAHDALIAYLIAHYPRSRLYERMYGASREHHRDGRYGLVPYEMFGLRTVIFWNGWWPFVFTNAVEKKAQSSRAPQEASSEAAKVYSTLTHLRGTLDVEAILRAACDAGNQLSWSVEGATEQSARSAAAGSRPVADACPGRHCRNANRSGWAW